MATRARPGANLAARPLVLATVPAGQVWRRLYDRRHPDPLGWGASLSRFSDPTGAAFGVVYLAASAKAAFVETVLRDRADGRGADCVIDMAEITGRALAEVRLRAPLRLVDLTGDGPLRMGVPSDVAGARDQTLARTWSAAFHAHPDRPDGVLYPSRLNKERCLAVYDRALGALETASTSPLLDRRAELAATLDDLEIALR